MDLVIDRQIAFSNGNPPRDDMTLLVLKIT
jgi:serine phosphatase RsbU (regulator of sigma subunit)